MEHHAGEMHSINVPLQICLYSSLPRICPGFRGRPCVRSWVTEKVTMFWIRDAVIGGSSVKIFKNPICVLLFQYSFFMCLRYSVSPVDICYTCVYVYVSVHEHMHAHLCEE
jgi:hypothetical protein